MDLDVIVLKPLDELHNTLGSELSTNGELRLNGAILAFDKSRWESVVVHHILCERVLAFLLLWSIIMPMFLGLCASLCCGIQCKPFEFCAVFWMNNDVHIGVFFFFSFSDGGWD